jgi:hypothetical protein
LSAKCLNLPAYELPSGYFLTLCRLIRAAAAAVMVDVGNLSSS